MKKDDLIELLKKYENGSCNAEEKAIVESFFLMLKEEPAKDSEEELDEAIQEIWAALPGKEQKAIKMNWPLRIATIAAAITVIIGIWTVVFVKTPSSADCDCDKDINPGTNKATLTLPNGKIIDLNEVKNGELAVDQGVKIIKQADGQLLYQFNAGVKAASAGKRDTVSSEVQVNSVQPNPLLGLNSVVTPRGGQYHIALPDGTNVWLNAGSTLRFPSTFEGLKERKVLLTGEAYFEVKSINSVFGREKRARKQPFIVKTATQEVTVLGTHFNINSYPDEPTTKTTLLEGAVSITAPLLQADGTVLKPGQQGVNDGGEIKVKKVDVEEAVAWKNGYFQFDNVGIEAMMRQFSRWYNIEVIYSKGIPKGNFRGQLPRNMTLQKALDVLSFSEINYKLEGRKLNIKSE